MLNIKEEKNLKTIKAINYSFGMASVSQIYQLKMKDIFPISNLLDMKKIPFTTKQELRDHYPYGNLATDFSNVIEMHMSSGTTGKPTLSFYTKNDLDEGSKAISMAWSNFGVDKNSRVQFMMGYGLFSGAPLNTYAIQSLGAFVLPSGIQPIAKQVQLLQDFSIDTVVATPSYYLYLYDYLVQNDIPPSSLKLKRGIAAGEVYSNEMKNKIAKLFSVDIYDHYGLCEVNTGIIYECKSCGGMVVLDDYVYAEVIDPVTGDVLDEGQVGELVLTSLRKEASPIVRYKTGDITSLKFNFSECIACYGCTVLDRVKLRYDSMIFYKGVKLEPYELRDMIICFAQDKIHNRVRIQINENSFQGRPKILVTLRSNIDKSLLESIQGYLKSKTGVSFIIENVPHTYFGEFTSTKDKIVEYVN